LGGLDTPGYATNVALSSNYLCVADVTAGLQILPRQCGLATSVESGALLLSASSLWVSPNPGRGEATIHFAAGDGPSAGSVRLSIYDCAGRFLRRLVDGRVSPGRHNLRWDGRDEGGRRMPSGIYLARLTAGAEVRTDRIVLVE
jgi:hypothetical protein